MITSNTSVISLSNKVLAGKVMSRLRPYRSRLIDSLGLPLAFAFIFIRKYNLRVKSIYEGVRKKLGSSSCSTRPSP